MGGITITLFCIYLLTGTVAAITISEVKQDNAELPVSVNSGVVVSWLPDVLLYTHTEFMTFLVPDLPDPPQVSSDACNREIFSKAACDVFAATQQGVQDISTIMTVINRILTSRGQQSVDISADPIPPEYFSAPNNQNIRSSPPSDSLVDSVGEAWFDEANLRLALRSLSDGKEQKFSNKQKRWLQGITKLVGPAMKVANHLGLPDFAHDMFKKLFAGDHDILSYVLEKKVLTPAEYQTFTELPAKVSELEVETQRLLKDLLQNTDVVKKLANSLDENKKGFQMKMAEVEESYLLQQNSIADLLRYVFLTNVYMAHFVAFSDCQTGKLSTVFVPPSLLRERLQKIHNTIPPEMELAIPLSDFEQFYRQRLTKCVFDSNGGLIEVQVPLVLKRAKFQLMQFRPIHFAYEDSTCALNFESEYIIRDGTSNSIFAISDIDEEECNPIKSGLCKVPMSTADDATNFCMSNLLTGTPTSEIKESCKLQCVKGSRPQITQMTESVFNGVHLPTGVELICLHHRSKVHQQLSHGSVKFTLGCGCKIMLRDQVLAKTDPATCDKTIDPNIVVLLPIQFTNIGDMVSKEKSTEEGLAVFSHAAEIFEESFDPRKSEIPPNETGYWEIGYIVSWLFDLIQTAVIIYLNSKLHSLTRLTLAAPVVRAATDHTCKLPNDIYVMLAICIFFSVLTWVPWVIKKVYNCIRDGFENRVHIEAHRMALQG